MGTAIPPIGRQLKRWRGLRRLSQLELSSRARVTPRHLSFIETGRSRPGRDVVLRLAESLALPLREQNELLRAAGLAAAWPEESLGDAGMAPVAELIRQMLDKHSPFPAFVLDRWWDVVSANTTAVALFLPKQAQVEVPNLAELLLRPGPPGELIDNLDEVLWALAVRLSRDLEMFPGDERLQGLLQRVLEATGTAAPLSAHDEPVLHTRLRIGGQRVSTLSTIVHFSGASAVQLEELRVELVYPADEASRAFFEGLEG